MAEQQDRPDEKPESAAQPAEPAASAPAPDPAPAAAEPPVPPAKKPPAKKAAKKTPAKAAKKAPAKKAPAKKAPAKKAAAKKVSPPPPTLADTNGDLTSAAKETAAQAKSAVSTASNPVAGAAPAPLIGPEPSRLPMAAAITAGVLAILVVLLIRRNSDD